MIFAELHCEISSSLFAEVDVKYDTLQFLQIYVPREDYVIHILLRNFHQKIDTVELNLPTKDVQIKFQFCCYHNFESKLFLGCHVHTKHKN